MSHFNVHSMKSHFDEKPFRWKIASMKSRFTEKPLWWKPAPPKARLQGLHLDKLQPCLQILNCSWNTLAYYISDLIGQGTGFIHELFRHLILELRGFRVTKSEQWPIFIPGSGCLDSGNLGSGCFYNGCLGIGYLGIGCLGIGCLGIGCLGTGCLGIGCLGSIRNPWNTSKPGIAFQVKAIVSLGLFRLIAITKVPLVRLLY